MAGASSRDTQRSRLYAAEVRAFEHTLVDKSVGLEGLATLAAILWSTSWWRAQAPTVAPVIVPARRDARRSVASRDGSGRWTIRIAVGHDQPPTLSHEAAHVLCGVRAASFHRPVAAHGPEFRAAHLATCRLLCGPHGADLLAGAYRAGALAWEEQPAWPTPEEADAHGILGRWRSAIAL